MGCILRNAREEAKMTQEQLAAASGVSRSTIVALEKGEEKDVKASTLLKLAEALGKSVRDIFFLN